MTEKADAHVLTSGVKGRETRQQVNKVVEERERATIMIQGWVRGAKIRQQKKDPLSDLCMHPDRAKAEKIVLSLDRDGDGQVTIVEVKTLFSKLLDIPVTEIPDDNDEVQQFAGLSMEEMIDMLS